MTPLIDSIIASVYRTGDLARLYMVIDCDRYTRTGDLRALEGLGWPARELSDTEKAKVEAAIADIEGWGDPS